MTASAILLNGCIAARTSLHVKPACCPAEGSVRSSSSRNAEGCLRRCFCRRHLREFLEELVTAAAKKIFFLKSLSTTWAPSQAALMELTLQMFYQTRLAESMATGKRGHTSPCFKANTTFPAAFRLLR